MYATKFLVFIIPLMSPCLCWYPRVVTPQGPIVGRTDYSRDGRRFYMFDGIPYAKPPTGQRRFKPPEAMDPWKDDLDATQAQVVCLQHAMTRRLGTEDCLVLNVYTPKLVANDSPLSVIVYIHGGNFNMWTSARLIAGGPEFFMDEDIVLVTLNYRLGLFGFGSSGDSVAPGNYGLLDQVAALRWIQQNIASFGGNPDSVTLFGVSAGGASVHLHMQSPLTEGLFHRAVSQSGTAFSGFSRGKLQINGTREVAEILNCPVNTSIEMMDCLRERDPEQLIEAVAEGRRRRQEAGKSFFELPHAWTPRIDYDAEEPYLPRNPVQVFSKGDYRKMPFIIGNSKDEFISEKDFLPFMVKEYGRLKTEWPMVCGLLLLHCGLEEKDLDSTCAKEICKLLEEKYMKEEGQHSSTLFKYGGLLHGVHLAIDLMIPHDQPIYSYSLNYYSEDQSIFDVFISGPKKPRGAIHANDFIYLFTFPMIRLDTKEEKISRDYLAFLASFAKTGVPKFPDEDVDWVPIKSPDFLQLKFDYFSSIQKKDHDEHYQLWNQIWKKIEEYLNKRVKDEL